MQVTKISQQLKRTDRLSIYIDGRYSFSLHQSQLADSSLRVGSTLTPAELTQLKAESTFGKAYEKFLNWATVRPRSQKELGDYLRRKGYDDQLSRRLLERLHKRGYNDDTDFAKSWVDGRQLHKQLSRRQLTQELRQKGVAAEIIDEVLVGADLNEAANLQALVLKKRRLSRYQDEAKLKAYLARQGFPYHLITEVLASNQEPGD